MLLARADPWVTAVPEAGDSHELLKKLDAVRAKFDGSCDLFCSQSKEFIQVRIVNS
jgi:hypothetical protein